MEAVLNGDIRRFGVTAVLTTAPAFCGFRGWRDLYFEICRTTPPPNLVKRRPGMSRLTYAHSRAREWIFPETGLTSSQSHLITLLALMRIRILSNNTSWDPSDQSLLLASHADYLPKLDSNNFRIRLYSSVQLLASTKP